MEQTTRDAVLRGILTEYFDKDDVDEAATIIIALQFDDGLKLTIEIDK